MIPRYPIQLIKQTDESVNPNGSLSTAFFYVIRDLFNRTGMAAGYPFQVGAGLVAAGAVQSTALQLTEDYNEVLTGNGGVMLTALAPDQQQWVYNGLGGNLNVYPALMGQINALAVNAPFVLGSGKTQIFICTKLLTTGGSFYRTVTLG
jgi:hypothetical protein